MKNALAMKVLPRSMRGMDGAGAGYPKNRRRLKAHPEASCQSDHPFLFCCLTFAIINSCCEKKNSGRSLLSLLIIS